MAYTTADRDALKAAIQSGATSVHLPNGESISLGDRARIEWILRMMAREIRGTQTPSSHYTVFDRGL
jgi:hypothetical protein